MGVQVREKQKGSGVYWIFINHHGKRRAKKIGKKSTANKIAERVNAKLILGEYNFEKTERQPTFKEVAEIWLSTPHDWKEATKESYRATLENHVYPEFAKREITAIKRKHLKLFFDKLYRGGLTVGTIKVIKAPIAGIMAIALESELIETNPIIGITMNYKSQKKEVEPLSEDEAMSLLEQSKEFVGGKYHPVLLTLLRTGVRIGELQALTWGCIDFENRTMEIKQSWRSGRFSSTKNKKRRKVDMTPLLTDVLRDHRTSQKRAAIKAGKPFSNHVFTGDRQEILGRVAFQNALNRCSERAELHHIRTHDLRHSYATIRLMRGHNIGDVSYQLGHSSISMTLDVYAHWIPGGFKSEVDDLDNPKSDKEARKEAMDL